MQVLLTEGNASKVQVYLGILHSTDSEGLIW
jgi:hypothetical protein